MASRQSWAFSRDRVLPFSTFLYRINHYSGTPVNCVWFTAFCGVLLGLLAFAGPAAIGAVFTLGVIALYFSYSVAIIASSLVGRRSSQDHFTLAHSYVFSSWCYILQITLVESTCCNRRCSLDGIRPRRATIPSFAPSSNGGHELRSCCLWWNTYWFSRRAITTSQSMAECIGSGDLWRISIKVTALSDVDITTKDGDLWTKEIWCRTLDVRSINQCNVRGTHQT